MQVTNCEALNIHCDRWTREEIPIRHTLKSLQRIIGTVEAVQNATSQLLFELDTLKGRQAASAALQVAQFFLFAGYLFTLYTVKKCKKHRTRLMDEEIKLMESRLANRKAKQRAQAARKAAQETQ